MVGLWRMKKRNGWSAKNNEGIIRARSATIAAVAAAASVPSSLTSTKALWTTFDRTKLFAGDKPVSGGGKNCFFPPKISGLFNTTDMVVL